MWCDDFLCWFIKVEQVLFLLFGNIFLNQTEQNGMLYMATACANDTLSSWIGGIHQGETSNL